MGDEEKFFALRRADGEPIDDYSWVVTDGPNDWEWAENNSEWADPESVEYEIVEMTVRSVAKKKLPENPHVEAPTPTVMGQPLDQGATECEYCGEPWPCEWMKERERADV